MTQIRVRAIFSQSTLARLNFDEPVSAGDAETGIELHYRFEDALGGRLRLTGGLLRQRVLSVGCDPDDINAIATIMIDGLKAQLR